MNPMRALAQFRLVVALFGLVAASAFVRADEPKDKAAAVIPAAEAKDHLDESLTVEMVVKSVKNEERVKVFFLDSEEDYKDEKNVAVLIAYEFGPKFKELGIDDPCEHYKGKKIRVTGKIVKEGKQTRMRVTDPKQISVVEPK
ncbi:MAG: hypothetical protein SFX72_16450 [Isosphaeraceae bacterium]|nr:hypothetical protein [Isosphaeraceae bacterium]